MAQFTTGPGTPQNPGAQLDFKGIANCEDPAKFAVVCNGANVPFTPANPCANGQFAFSCTAPACVPGGTNIVIATAKDNAGHDVWSVGLNCP